MLKIHAAHNSRPSVMMASISTCPAILSTDPWPALKTGLSSRLLTASSTARTKQAMSPLGGGRGGGRKKRKVEGEGGRRTREEEGGGIVLRATPFLRKGSVWYFTMQRFVLTPRLSWAASPQTYLWFVYCATVCTHCSHYQPVAL